MNIAKLKFGRFINLFPSSQAKVSEFVGVFSSSTTSFLREVSRKTKILSLTVMQLKKILMDELMSASTQLEVLIWRKTLVKILLKKLDYSLLIHISMTSI